MTRKVDPYGRDKPSPIPSPTKPSGEWVPGYNPPGVPPWLKPIPVNTRDTLAVLRSYLNAREPKVARWLYSTWNAEREAIKYQELRNAVRDHEMPLEWILRWQQDYSEFVVNVLDPEWRRAIQTAGQTLGDSIEQYAGRPFGFTPTGRRVEEWIQTRGGELAVNLSDIQHQALRAILRHYTVDKPVSAEELGRIIRPIIGLTPKQAEAVRRFRENLIAQGLPMKKVEHQVGNYAGYLHRLRALRIARTELAFSYNFGQLEAIRQAKEQGYFGGEVVKEWMTAKDELVCDHCGPLDGQIIGLEETFPGVTQKLPYVYVPPAHPMCRCTVGYRVLEPQDVGGMIGAEEEVTAPALPAAVSFDEATRMHDEMVEKMRTYLDMPENWDPRGKVPFNLSQKAWDYTSKIIAREIEGHPLLNDFVKLLVDAKEWAAYNEGASLTEQTALTLIFKWAGTSGDSDPLAVAMQMIARDSFGLSDAAVDHLMKLKDGASKELFDILTTKYRDLIEKALRAQYTATQSFLADAGVDYVPLFRGMVLTKGAFGAESYGVGEIMLQPMSSFTFDVDKACFFARMGSSSWFGEEGESYVLMAVVPREKIFSSFATGFGTMKESEVVVLGGKLPTAYVEGSVSVEKVREKFNEIALGRKARLISVPIDEILENADWPKQSWGLPPWDELPEGFRRRLRHLPAYKLPADIPGLD